MRFLLVVTAMLMLMGCCYRVTDAQTGKVYYPGFPR